MVGERQKEQIASFHLAKLASLAEQIAEKLGALNFSDNYRTQHQLLDSLPSQVGLRNHEQPTVSFAHVDQYLGLIEYQKLDELLLLGLQANPVSQSRHQIDNLHQVRQRQLQLLVPRVSPLEVAVLNH